MGVYVKGSGERLSVCVYVCSLCERERNIRSVCVSVCGLCKKKRERDSECVRACVRVYTT